MDRRRFLLVAGATTTAAAAFGVHRLFSTNGALFRLDRSLEEYVAGRFSPELGAAYLVSQRVAIEDVNEVLATSEYSFGPDDDIHAGIQRLIASDFAGGDICLLDGWHLSLTECRLAAVAYVVSRNGGWKEGPPERTEEPLDHLPALEFARVEGWGPRSCKVGEPFNVQPSGGSALWFKFIDLDRYPDYRIYFGFEAAITTINAGKRLITARVSADQSRRLTSKEGLLPVHLVDPVRGKQLIGYFEVKP